MSSGATSSAGGGLRPIRCKEARTSAITARRFASERLIASSAPVIVSSLASVSPIFRSLALTFCVASRSAAVSFARSARIEAISASICRRCSCDASIVSSMPRSSSRWPLSSAPFSSKSGAAGGAVCAAMQMGVKGRRQSSSAARLAAPAKALLLCRVSGDTMAFMAAAGWTGRGSESRESNTGQQKVAPSRQDPKRTRINF